MAKNPVFPLYYNDILGSTQDWTDEEFGAYVRLLVRQWDKGFIPVDFIRLNKIADSAERHWPLLQEKFPAGEDGKLRNLKCEEIRIEKQKHSEKQKNNIRNRYQTSTKPLTDDNTKKIPLEDEYEIEEESKENIGGMGEKGDYAMVQSSDPGPYIVPRMLTIWKKEFPKYLISQEKDMPALCELAIALCAYLQKPQEFSNGVICDCILELWDNLAKHIKSNSHYSSYNLAQVAKYIQSIIQSFNRPKEPDKTALQYLYDRYCEGGLHHSLINDEHYEELFSRKLVSVDEKLIHQVKTNRIKTLNGSNQAKDLRLLEAYQNGKDPELLQQDHLVIVSHAKKTAVMAFFKKQKAAKATNILEIKK